jgi:hypothetical protein
LRRLLLFIGLLASCLSACQLRVAVDVAVESDGSGAFELAVALDEELAQLLEDADVDVLADLDAVRGAVPDWSVTVEEATDGLTVVFGTTFEEPEGLATRTDGLHDALDEVDGRIFRDLALVLEDDRLRFTGQVGVLPPEAPGATGAGVTFDADDLRELLEQRGDEFVRYDVRIELPHEPERHDGDEVEDTSVVWHAPIGELRSISAEASVAGDRQRWFAIGIATLAAAVAAAVVVGFRLRGRRSRRR